MSLRSIFRVGFTLALLCAVGGGTASGQRRQSKPPATLRLLEVAADSTAFDVVATAIVGPTESVLWDALYLAPDAERMADSLAATHTHLKAIILSHPDEDHVSATAVILARFPGTPVYITEAGLRRFQHDAPPRFAADKKRFGARFADTLATPIALPTTHFTVDSVAVDVMPDLTGDAGAAMNSALWIPSMSALLVGDIVFNEVHPWLGASDSTARAAWRASLARLEDLHPAIVVAGHKRAVALPDSPTLLASMTSYLDDFERSAKDAQQPTEIRAQMIAKYPGRGVPALIGPGAMKAFQQYHPGVAIMPPGNASGAGSGARGMLAVGRWTGTISPPEGGELATTYDVGRDADGSTAIGVTVEGRPALSATNVRVAPGVVTFELAPGTAKLKCSLERQADESYRGACDSDVGRGLIVMRPPRS